MDKTFKILILIPTYLIMGLVLVVFIVNTIPILVFFSIRYLKPLSSFNHYKIMIKRLAIAIFELL